MIDKSVNRYLVFGCLPVMPWLFVCLLREFGPIHYESLSSDLYFYLIVVIFVALIGYTLGFMVNSKVEDNDFAFRKYDFLWFLIVIASVVFPLISFCDHYFIKGASLGNIVQQRELEHFSGPRNSVIGAMIAFMSGIPAVSLVVKLEVNRKGQYDLLYYFFIILGFVSMFLTGGRNSFFISVAYVLVYCLLYKDCKSLFNSVCRLNARVCFVIVTFCYAFYYSMNIFLLRLDYQGIKLSESLKHLKDQHHLEIMDVDFQSEFFTSLYVIYVYVVFYLTHSVQYLNKYFEANYSPLIGGCYNFPLIGRIFDFIFKTNIFDTCKASLLVEGIYLSLPGGLYLDFGYQLSLFFVFYMSLLYGVLSRNYSGLKLFQKMFLVYIIVLYLYSPMYSVLAIGNGFSVFLIISFLLCGSLVFCRVK